MFKKKIESLSKPHSYVLDSPKHIHADVSSPETWMHCITLTIILFFLPFLVQGTITKNYHCYYWWQAIYLYKYIFQDALHYIDYHFVLFTFSRFSGSGNNNQELSLLLLATGHLFIQIYISREHWGGWICIDTSCHGYVAISFLDYLV